MFDIGWTELLLVGIVALIVVGPQDLPKMFRTLGKFTAKARAMAREFQTSLEAAAEESGVGDITKDLKSAASMKNLGLDAVKDAVGDMAKSPFDPDEIRRKIEASDQAAGVTSGIEAEIPDAAPKTTSKAASKSGAKKKAGAVAKAKAAKSGAAKPKAAKSTAAKSTANKAAAKKPAKKPAAKKPATKASTSKSPAAKAEK